jgi:hypothetical protein
MALIEEQKPSFLRSTWEGIKGYIKGSLAGALIGIVGGAAIGAAIAAIFPVTVPFMIAAAGTLGLSGLASGGIAAAGTGAGTALLGGSAALTGAMVGGTFLGSTLSGLGGIAGAFVGVKQSMDAAQTSSAALVNALNMAHQHGELAGQQQVIQQLNAAQQKQQPQAQSDKWQKYHEQREQAATALQTQHP